MIRTETDVWAATVARILIGGFFAIGGANNLLNLSTAIESASAAGMPLAPIVTILVALLKIGLGTLIIIKFHTKLASLLLALYITGATLLFYNPLFWSAGSSTEAVFIRNIALLSALLSLYAHSRGVKMLQSSKPTYKPTT